MFNQVLIPGFPHGAQRIGEALSILEKAEGKRPAEVARVVGINESALRKAVKRKAIPILRGGAVEPDDKAAGSTKTERSRADADAASGIGTACTRADERVAAAMGLDRKSTRLNSSHGKLSRMPSSA